MTHADIVAWWAVGISVFAILAHIPLTMLAHWLLPKIQNYRASRSREKLIKRISKLQTRLAALNDPRYFEEIEWGFHVSLFAMMYCLGAGLIGLALCLFLAMGMVRPNWFWGSLKWHILPGITVGFFVAILLVAGLNVYTVSQLVPSKRSVLRSDIQAQIEALKRRLREKFDNKN